MNDPLRLLEMLCCGKKGFFLYEIGAAKLAESNTFLSAFQLTTNFFFKFIDNNVILADQDLRLYFCINNCCITD